MRAVCVVCVVAMGVVCNAHADDYVQNLIPNGSFENFSGQPVADYAPNGGDSVLEGWTGGFITCGQKSFCKSAMYDGLYGLLLHTTKSVASNSFDVVRDATYELTFRAISRDVGLAKHLISVYFDEDDEPVCTVQPMTYTRWDFYSATRRFSPGRHLIRFVVTTLSGSDSSTTIDDVRLVRARENLLPNGGFEEIVGLGTEDYTGNGGTTRLQGWNGGLITCGGDKTFCKARMAEGRYGLVFHHTLPIASNRFEVAETDVYELSFRTVSRLIKDQCQQTVSAYLDNETEPVCSVLPTSVDFWDFWSFKCPIKRGSHVLRFVATNPLGANGSLIDSSTVIDDVQIRRSLDGVLTNGSFEQIRGDPQLKYGNASAAGWEGGIITCGLCTIWDFCQAKMPDGVLGLALHNQHPTTSNRFRTIWNGTYELSFRTVSRNLNDNKDGRNCRQTVSVYFDDETEPVGAVLPTSVSDWNAWSFKCKLKSGSHVLRFVGTTPLDASGNHIDSTTIIDDVRLELTRRDEGLAIVIQ